MAPRHLRNLRSRSCRRRPLPAAWRRGGHLCRQELTPAQHRPTLANKRNPYGKVPIPPTTHLLLDKHTDCLPGADHRPSRRRASGITPREPGMAEVHAHRRHSRRFDACVVAGSRAGPSPVAEFYPAAFSIGKTPVNGWTVERPKFWKSAPPDFQTSRHLATHSGWC